MHLLLLTLSYIFLVTFTIIRKKKNKCNVSLTESPWEPGLPCGPWAPRRPYIFDKKEDREFEGLVLDCRKKNKIFKASSEFLKAR